MEWNEGQQRAALHARAVAAMAGAVAAVNARVLLPDVAIASAMTAVNLACWNARLEPRERVLLIDESLLLLRTLKELSRAPENARPGLTIELLRGTNELLKRYADYARVRG